MKPIFTVHEGEFLVGDHINRKLGRKYDVWVPTKDTGVDLLVTRKRRSGRAVGLQVKFSRSFSIPEELARHLIATSWFTLEPKKIRNSQADLWVFVIMTLKHDQHFVVHVAVALAPVAVGQIRSLISGGQATGACRTIVL